MNERYTCIQKGLLSQYRKNSRGSVSPKAALAYYVHKREKEKKEYIDSNYWSLFISYLYCNRTRAVVVSSFLFQTQLITIACKTSEEREIDSSLRTAVQHRVREGDCVTTLFGLYSLLVCVRYIRKNGLCFERKGESSLLPSKRGCWSKKKGGKSSIAFGTHKGEVG